MTSNNIPEEFVRRDVPLQTCMNCEYVNVPGDYEPCIRCGVLKEGWRAKVI